MTNNDVLSNQLSKLSREVGESNERLISLSCNVAEYNKHTREEYKKQGCRLDRLEKWLLIVAAITLYLLYRMDGVSVIDIINAG